MRKKASAMGLRIPSNRGREEKPLLPKRRLGRVLRLSSSYPLPGAATSEATLSTRKGRRRLPAFVQRKGKKFRCWAIDPDGKRVYGKSFDDPLVAHQQGIEMRMALHEVESARATLGQMMDMVLASPISAGTKHWYGKQFTEIKRHWPAETMLRAITPKQLAEFIAKRLKVVSANSVNHHRRALASLFNHAISHGLVQSSPMKRVKWPRMTQTPMAWFEADELRGLLARVVVECPRQADIVLVAAYTGLRRSELARLEAADVALDAGVLWVKGKVRSEPVPIPTDIVAPLKRLMAKRPTGPLVPGGPAHMSYLFERVAKKLGEPRFRTHALRHSLATMLVRAGEKPDVVQHLMRHKTWQMTLRYFHVASKELQVAASRIRLLPTESACSHG